mmetsp:Transcript_987/g.1919  ORF Transcript_987/g.1919 Transcript_987/m.1919 type:complete len:179 (+) Transcript_987:326-862(+)
MGGDHDLNHHQHHHGAHLEVDVSESENEVFFTPPSSPLRVERRADSLVKQQDAAAEVRVLSDAAVMTTVVNMQDAAVGSAVDGERADGKSLFEVDSEGGGGRRRDCRECARRKLELKSERAKNAALRDALMDENRGAQVTLIEENAALRVTIDFLSQQLDLLNNTNNSNPPKSKQPHG